MEGKDYIIHKPINRVCPELGSLSMLICIRNALYQ